MLLLVRPARDMLDKALEMSSAYGFETRNYDNFCGSAVYGDNPDNDSIGIVAHMDIVPENMCNLANDAGGWTHDPFDPILSEDGKYLFARGTLRQQVLRDYGAVRHAVLKRTQYQTQKQCDAGLWA